MFHSADAGQPAGMVVNAAPDPRGGWSALAEVKLAALEGGTLHCSAGGGGSVRRAFASCRTRSPRRRPCAGMRELFVYYRVATADAAAAQAQVQALHAQLRGIDPGLDARLLRRPDEADGQQTWMETYALDAGEGPAGVGPELQAEIEARAGRLLTLIDGPRHVEVFVPCAS